MDVNVSNGEKIILDLCAGTGSWSLPYRRMGYDVRLITLPEYDVRTYRPPKPVYGVLAAPPCTEFSLSGARWWKEKGNQALMDALAIVDACMRIILLSRPKFWCLENPVGRLKHYLGEPVMRFDPCDFGDHYTKKTCLWGRFNKPRKNRVEPTEGSKMQKLPDSKGRAEKRAETPLGFAMAFWAVNQ